MDKVLLIINPRTMVVDRAYPADELEEVSCGQEIVYDDPETKKSGLVKGGFYFQIVEFRSCSL